MLNFKNKIEKVKKLFSKRDKKDSLLSIKNALKEENDIWQDDLLEQKEIAYILTNRIKTIINQPSLIFLNMESGSGKTFFLKKWTEHLNNQGETALYYNSWNINSTEQLLAPFIDFLFSKLFAAAKVKTDLVKKFEKVSNSILSLNTLNKMLSKSPLGILSVFIDVTKDAVEKDNPGLMFNDISLYQKKQKSLLDFKIHFSEIIDKVRRNNKNLYIIIDDLDYCRPKATIDFLEQIKYIFNIPGMIFICGLQTDNIKANIKSVLGSNINVAEYLKRLLDLRFNFPKCNNMDRYIHKLYDNSGFNKILNDNEDKLQYKLLLINSFKSYSRIFGLSPASIKQCIAKISSIVHLQNSMFLPNLLVFLIILDQEYSDLYDSLETISMEELVNRLEEKRKMLLKDDIDTSVWESIKNLLNAISSKDKTQINTLLQTEKSFISKQDLDLLNNKNINLIRFMKSIIC